MEVSQLKRDRKKILDAVRQVKVGDDVSLVAAKEVKVYLPKHWTESNLGSIDEKFNSLCVICFVVEGKFFAHLEALTKISLNPYDISTVKIEDVEYYELSYQKGETICDSLTLVQDKNIVYEVFNEKLAKAKMPFYFRYADVLTIFDTSQLHAGYNTGTDFAIESLMSANRARDEKNPNKLFRYTLQKQEDLDTMTPVMLGLTSVSGATNASSRIMGNYMKDGLVESIIDPTSVIEEGDKVLFL